MRARSTRGTIKQRSEGSWTLRVSTGNYVPSKSDPSKLVRQRHVETFRGTEKDARKRLTAILGSNDNGVLVEPSKITLRDWLPKWLEIRKPELAANTFERYTGIIGQISEHAIASLALQKIRPSHLEAYYAGLVHLAASTKTLHHAVLFPALRKAVRDRLIAVNPASDLDGKPKRRHTRTDDAKLHCWTATEARAFLGAAKAAGPRQAAFYSLALDSGMRKGELCGLRWSDVDLASGKVRVVRQLLKPGPKPVFGPTKTKRPRTIAVSGSVVDLLRTHKKHQSRDQVGEPARLYRSGSSLLQGIL